MSSITFFKKTTAAVSLGAALLFSACSSQPTPDATTSTAGAPAANEKSGDTIKTGTISEAGGSFFLQEAGQTPQQIDSYAVDLSAYVGQTVTVTGQYSGDTLFVGKVE